jgi:hypothetical protein
VAGTGVLEKAVVMPATTVSAMTLVIILRLCGKVWQRPPTSAAQCRRLPASRPSELLENAPSTAAAPSVSIAAWQGAAACLVVVKRAGK